MRLYSGYIKNYNQSNNYQITTGMITSYSPAEEDVILVTSAPNASGSNTSDNVNVYVVWNNTNSVWEVYTSDASYTGDIAFTVITQ